MAFLEELSMALMREDSVLVSVSAEVYVSVCDFLNCRVRREKKRGHTEELEQLHRAAKLVQVPQGVWVPFDFVISPL